MDITTLVKLRDSGAGMVINLRQELYRGYKEWNLYAEFEFVGVGGKKNVTHVFQLATNRHPAALRARLESAGLSYIETPLPTVEQPVPSRPAAVQQSTSKSCGLCGKTDFDMPSGCQNPSVFSPCVGDWVCNLKVAQ
jgi:hypothetical protein